MISNIFRRFSSTAKVIFNDVKLNKTYPIQVPLGSNLLDIAIEHNMNIEHACDGQLACSSCHIVLDKADYKKIINHYKKFKLPSSVKKFFLKKNINKILLFMKKDKKNKNNKINLVLLKKIGKVKYDCQFKELALYRFFSKELIN